MSFLRKVLSDLRRLPVRVIARKAAHRLRRELETRTDRRRAERGLLGISEVRFRRQVAAGMPPEEWSNRFLERLSSRSLVVGECGLDAFLGAGAVEGLLQQAERITRHEFDLLGSGLVRVHHGMSCGGRSGIRFDMPAPEGLGRRIRERVCAWLPAAAGYEPIDWHLDFVSGYRWSEEVWHADIASRMPLGADIKVPWELSRCNHFLLLARAASVGGESRFAIEIHAQMLDFMLSNPVGYGPCWACPMDVSIRLSNWLVALAWLARLGYASADIAWRIAPFLVDHARFIRRNLEWSAEVNGNHYSSNLAGLFLYGTMCPDLPGAASAARFGRTELEDQIGMQVLHDGCNFEGSTLYHRLVFEFFLYPAVLGARLGEPFSDAYVDRLRRMAAAMRGLAFGNGELIQIGDNDSGRFLTLDRHDPATTRADYLLPIADKALDGVLRHYPADVDLIPMLLVCGHGSPHAEGESWRDRGSVRFSDAGWVVLRKGGIECVASCGPNGQGGNGGHGHNDKLAVSLAIDGHLLLVDPGTYLYTADPEARNRYRATAMHSTPQLGQSEINVLPVGKAGLFTFPDRSRVRVIEAGDNWLRAMHEGFGDPVTLDLRVDLNTAVCSYDVGPGEFTLRWFFAPGVSAAVVNGLIELVSEGHRFQLVIAGCEPVLGSYDYSPAYGRKVQANLASITFQRNVSWVMRRVPS